ncbi:MAG: FkbM family methyltransferase [Flavobacteriaceae bacterium]
MKLKKTIKKIISGLIPQGIYKEYIKSIWYNILSNKKIHYGLVKRNKALIYKTKFEAFTFYTNQALYNITADFGNYQHYYKVKKGDVIIDGGANVGLLTLLFSKIVKTQGHVFAFEPDKHNIKMLNNNFLLNEHDTNYSVHDELLWSKNTEVNFQESGTVSSSALWFSDENCIVKKKAVMLDSWCKKNNIERLDYIKMDIEGAEIEAIEGCVEVIKKFNPNFAIASYHMVDNEPTYIKLETFFKSINYPFITKKFSGYEIITFAGPSVLND